jgi:hypothetical protein
MKQIGNLFEKEKKQLIEKNNEAENAKQIPHTYNIGDKVLIRRGTETNMRHLMKVLILSQK